MYSWILLVCMIGAWVRGEVRLVCPTPQFPDANIRDGACGGGGKVTQLSPGLFTVHIEEPVVHAGTPFRISLYDAKSPRNECILLNYIPHNDRLVGRVIPPECKLSSGVGQCGTSSYITVDIPDIRCEQCVLKVSQVITDGTDCSRFSERNGDCVVYHSCATVSIRPTDPASTETTRKCIYDYAFKTERMWKQRSSLIAYEPLYSTRFLFNNVAFKFIDDRKSIRFNITFPPTSRMSINNIQVFRRPRARRPMAIFGPSSPGRFIGTISPRKLRNFRTARRLGGPVLKIQHSDRRISMSGRLDLGYLFTPTGRFYTEDGWLTGDTFVGENATYNKAVTPAGRCAPRHGQFAVGLTNSTKHLGGMIVYKTTLQRTHLAAILPHPSPLDWDIKYTDTPDPTDLPYGINEENVLFATLNVSIKNAPEFRVSESTERKKMGGKAKNATQAHLWKNGNLMGVASIDLVSREKIDLQYVLSNFGHRVAAPKKISLVGPNVDGVLYTIEGSTNANGFPYGGWITQKTLDVDKPAVVVAYWSGHLVLKSLGPDFRFFYYAKFSFPDHDWCYGREHIMCDIMTLSATNGSGVTIGMASLVAQSNPPLLFVSVLLLNVPAGAGVTAVKLFSKRETSVTQNLASNFVPFSEESDALFEKQMTSPVSRSLASALNSGDLHLAVHVNSMILEAAVPVPKYIFGGPFPANLTDKTSMATSPTTRPSSTPPTTKQPSTSRPSSRPTTSSTTKQPSTSRPSTRPTTSSTTKQPSTSRPSTRPTTSSTTKQPSTSRPSTRPTTSSTTKQPSTSRPSTRPTTSSTTKQPSTSRPSTRPTTPSTTKQPSTSRPSTRPTTSSTTKRPPTSTTSSRPSTQPTTKQPSTSRSSSRPTTEPSTIVHSPRRPTTRSTKPVSTPLPSTLHTHPTQTSATSSKPQKTKLLGTSKSVHASLSSSEQKETTKQTFPPAPGVIETTTAGTEALLVRAIVTLCLVVMTILVIC